MWSCSRSHGGGRVWPRGAAAASAVCSHLNRWACLHSRSHFQLSRYIPSAFCGIRPPASPCLFSSLPLLSFSTSVCMHVRLFRPRRRPDPYLEIAGVGYPARGAKALGVRRKLPCVSQPQKAQKVLHLMVIRLACLTSPGLAPPGRKERGEGCKHGLLVTEW